MATKKTMDIQVTLESKSVKKIREYKQQIRDINKRIREVKLEEQIEDDIATWQKITKMKLDIQKQIKSVKGCSAWTITKFLKSPDYFEYQNPKNTKQKGSDDTADWVKKYLQSGGSKAELIARAREGRKKIAAKMFGRGRRKLARKKTESKDPAQKSGKNTLRQGGIK